MNKIVDWVFCDDRLPSEEDGYVFLLVVYLDNMTVDIGYGMFLRNKHLLTGTDWYEGQPMRIIAWAKKDLKDIPPNIPSMDVIKEHWEGAYGA